jgi:CheY-like chemotaxis protein
VLEVTIDNVEIDPETAKKYNRFKPGYYLRLTFSDTGIGMSRSVSRRIFEPFFTTKKMGEGTGMGLAVVHGIVRSHDGDITVYSEPGKGTTFHIFLPQIEDSSEPEPPAAEKLPGGSERILLVDDEAALAYVETEILGRLGYEVTGMSNAVEALKTFRRELGKFDLLITDLTMPQMTGIQLAEEVRRIKPGMPIIFCSGFSAAVTLEQIKDFGSDNFIMKPFNKRDLAKIIRKVFDKN